MAACGLLFAATAQAQISAQVSVANDYVYRGASLNDGRPAVMAAASYDSADGWFAAGKVAQTRLYSERHAEPVWTADVGYAHALDSRLSWEAGATYSVFTHFTFWNYAETFVGLAAENWNLRLYYAPNYFGRQRRSTYLEFDMTHPLNDRYRLIAHLGAQRSESARSGDRDHIFDASLGAGARFDRIDLQLLWVSTSRANYSYPVVSPEDRARWVLSATYAF